MTRTVTGFDATVQGGKTPLLPSISIDFETRSEIDLKKTGVYPYAQHASTSIWCMAYAIGDGEPVLWVPGDPVPLFLYKLVTEGHEIRAWNAQFERVIWENILVPRHGFPRVQLWQWTDTAAEAAAMALPRGLEQAAQVLGLPVEKDAEGHRLMMQMSKPRRPTASNPSEWWDDFERRQRLYAYCKQDVRVERAIAEKLLRLSANERTLYQLDQFINDRGVRVDVPLVSAALALTEQAKQHGNREVSKLTDGAVSAVTKVADLTGWLQGRGVEVNDLRKATVRELLQTDELGEVERAVAELRADTAKSSTAKLRAFLNALGWRDNRIRGLLLYHGAATGRWSGRLVQPQNFPRPTVKNIESLIPLVLAGDYEALAGHAPVMHVISSLLRSCMIASPGHRLMAGDYAQIEARVLAWIAGQDDLVQAFARGHKIYEDQAAFTLTRKLGRPVAIHEIGKDSWERQILGKMTILGCGFAMGWEAYAKQVKEQTGMQLSEEDARLAVDGYRQRNGEIVRFWKEIESAAYKAVRTLGTIHGAGRDEKIKFKASKDWLYCVLPSKRVLAYARPEIAERNHPKFGPRKVLVSWGVSSKTRRWQESHLYGGLLTENVVQAMARDFMAAGMLRLERQGYPVILTVHDEIVSDVPLNHGSVEDYERLMCVIPNWAEGLPAAAEGWEGERYRK